MELTSASQEESDLLSGNKDQEETGTRNEGKKGERRPGGEGNGNAGRNKMASPGHGETSDRLASREVPHLFPLLTQQILD